MEIKIGRKKYTIMGKRPVIGIDGRRFKSKGLKTLLFTVKDRDGMLLFAVQEEESGKYRIY